MDYQTRLLPTREALERVSGEFGNAESLVCVEMILLLLNTANRFRAEVFGDLERRHGLTEGKLILLMALSDNPKGLLTGELAKRVGVSMATVSVMVKRMLAAEQPLIVVTTPEEDARARLVKLSPAGKAAIREILPYHLAQIEAFSRKLDDSQRHALIELLKQLS